MWGRARNATVEFRPRGPFSKLTVFTHTHTYIHSHTYTRRNRNYYRGGDRLCPSTDQRADKTASDRFVNPRAAYGIRPTTISIFAPTRRGNINFLQSFVRPLLLFQSSSTLSLPSFCFSFLSKFISPKHDNYCRRKLTHTHTQNYVLLYIYIIRTLLFIYIFLYVRLLIL